jgi:hypothetical protein
MTTLNSEKESKNSTGKGGARPGAGRPKGSLDKGNALIREMACEALAKVGGVDYLARVAESHPGPFLSLLGKILPVQLTGDGGGAVETVTRIELVAMTTDDDAQD